MTSTPNSSQMVRKVFICNNGKCAESEDAQEIYEMLRTMIHDQGLDSYDAPNRIKCLLSGCLDICKNGPIMVVHPGAIFYQRVDRTALKKIFDKHLLNGEIVTENVYKPE